MSTNLANLYNRYRPTTFNNVVGQRPIVTVLRNAITRNRLAGSYLFRGPRGSGKTSTARILCKASNCTEWSSVGDVCGKCTGCLKSLEDAIELDAATHRGIPAIEELLESLHYRPKFVDKRFVIIDEAHQLTSGALNALLKIVEEPPNYIHFVFCTTDMSLIDPDSSVRLTEDKKAFATLSSRCQTFEFSSVDPDSILQKLNYICEKEGCQVSEDLLISLVGRSGGSLRDAENLLDMVLVLYENNPPDDVLRLLYGDVEFLSAEFLKECCLGSVTDGLLFASKLWDSGCSVQDVASRCLEFISDVIKLSAGLTVYRPSAIVRVLKEISDKVEHNRLNSVIMAFNELHNSNRGTILSLELVVCDSMTNVVESDAILDVSVEEPEVSSIHLQPW